MTATTTKVAKKTNKQNTELGVPVNETADISFAYFQFVRVELNKHCK